MGHLTSYRKNVGLFETIRTLAVLAVRQYPKKQLLGYRLSADKMCLANIYYSKFGYFEF
jgi:hypothetical protein